MNNFIYSGKVDGKLESTQHGGKMFKGLIGELNIWLYGRQAEAAEKYMGQVVVINGIVESRTSDNGRNFPQFRVFQVYPTKPTVRPNLILLNGEISSVQRIKDGLYNVGIDIGGKVWDKEQQQRVDVTFSIPVNVSAVNDSDIGKNASVVARLQVRDGKFTDIVADSFIVDGVGDTTSAPAADDASLGELDGLFAGSN